MMTEDEIKKDIEVAIDLIRRKRMWVAEQRYNALVERFPEIKEGKITKLSDDEIIMEALQRELNHLRQVVKDLQK